MDYDERIALVTNWFKAEIAVRFSMPNAIDPKVAATDVIEAVNSQLPSQLNKERIGNLLASITREVARSAKSRTLPPTKEFIDAARATVEAHLKASTMPTLPEENNSPARRVAALIRRGEPVGEHWFKGSMRQQLRDAGVTDDEMHPYDLYIAAHMQ